MHPIQCRQWSAHAAQQFVAAVKCQRQVLAHPDVAPLVTWPRRDLCAFFPSELRGQIGDASMERLDSVVSLLRLLLDAVEVAEHLAKTRRRRGHLDNSSGLRHLRLDRVSPESEDLALGKRRAEADEL